ncbi:MAG: hypothetical protein V9E82_10915 [Candidatus Nanopelagicales bacterium]
MNDSVVAVLEVMFSDEDPLDAAKAAEAVIGYCHARQLRAFHQVFVESELGADPDGVVVDPTPPEVACAMVWSPGCRLVDSGSGRGCGPGSAGAAGRAD